jgi:tripartite ATP-independent transporter DctP family solute receptor
MSLNLTRRATLAAAAGVLAAPHIARAAVRTVRFGHNNTAESQYGRGSDAFAQAVAEDPELSHVLRIEVHPKAELGDELGMLKGCADGTLDMMLCSNSVVGNIITETAVVNAPFLFRDVAHARAVMDGTVGQGIAAQAPAHNLHVLAWGENGLRHITANRPVRTPADLRGLKIRVPQSAVMLNGFLALGADAATLSFGQLRDALRSGQFQAQENPIGIIEAAKFQELQTHLSLTGHIYDPALFLASGDLIEDLTPAQAVALTAAAQKGAKMSRQAAAEAQRDGVGRLKAAGMIIVEDIDSKAFIAAARPYLESLAGVYGAERIKSLTNPDA